MRKITGIISALISAALLLSGCSQSDVDYTERSFAEDFTKVSEIVIDVRDRSVEISQSDDESIRINCYESEKEFYDIALSENGVLKMTAADSKEWSDYIGGNAPDENRVIKISLPASYAGNLSVSTTNENVSLSALTIKNSVDINVNGGNISFDQLNAEKSITLNVKNGDIRGKISGGYDDWSISCEIKKGDCNLPLDKDGGEKKLSVTANNGDIEIDLSQGNNE